MDKERKTKYMKKSYQQLNLFQRSKLEVLLKTEKSLSDIAKILDISRQTIYREIIRNSDFVSKDEMYREYSCKHYLECYKANNKMPCPNGKCAKYEKSLQSCLNRFPFVCNFCCKRNHCNWPHRFYDAHNASIKYHELLSSSRNEVKTPKETFDKINKLVSPLVKQGQSVEAILMNHNDVKVSAITIRKWINKRILSCNPTQLRLFGRRTPSKAYNYSKKKEHVMCSELKYGHKYIDYLEFIKNNPNSLIIELDTVIGNMQSKKSVLTIHIVKYKFQFGFLLDSHTSNEVLTKLINFIDKLRRFDEAIGTALERQFVTCILTDNGAEFDKILQLCEYSKYCNVFYCNPYSSFQKGSCERNHVLIRYIKNKGISFDDLTQKKLNLIFSHINSYPRKSLNKKTPYQCIVESLGKEFTAFAGISEVRCDDVNLTPSLIK